MEQNYLYEIIKNIICPLVVMFICYVIKRIVNFNFRFKSKQYYRRFSYSIDEIYSFIVLYLFFSSIIICAVYVSLQFIIEKVYNPNFLAVIIIGFTEIFLIKFIYIFIMKLISFFDFSRNYIYRKTYFILTPYICTIPEIFIVGIFLYSDKNSIDDMVMINIMAIVIFMILMYIKMSPKIYRYHEVKIKYCYGTSDKYRGCEVKETHKNVFILFYNEKRK